MRTKSLSETTLKFSKYIIKMIWKLFAHEHFKYFGDNRENTFWSIIILKVSRILFESRCYIDQFEKFNVFWWTDTFIELKSYLFSKKVCIFFQNFDGDIGVLHSSISTQIFCLFRYSIYLLVKNKSLNYVARSGK